MVTLTEISSSQRRAEDARDQAATLRELVARQQAVPHPPAAVAEKSVVEHRVSQPPPVAPKATPLVRRACPLIAVASGKGGVGKTTIAANLAVALARNGLRMTLVDADLGMANADLVLGVHSKRRLGPSSISQPGELRSLAVNAPSGVRLVPGATGISSMADLSLDERRRLVAGMLDLTTDADALLIDTSAGASRTTLGFTAAADSVLLVSTPDPSSIADVYATIKCLSHSAAARASRVGADPVAASHEQLGRIGLLINMADTEREANATSQRLCEVSAKYLGRAPQVLGWVPRDPSLGKSVRLGQAHLERTSRGRSARSFEGVAQIVHGVISQWRCADAGSPSLNRGHHS